MKTPFGFDCEYFYADYFRGRNVEECRLVGHQPPPNNWTVSVCKDCIVPGILRANACKNMVLTGRIRKGFLGLRRRMEVEAFCTKVNKPVQEPQIGCGECHPLPDIFKEK